MADYSTLPAVVNDDDRTLDLDDDEAILEQYRQTVRRCSHTYRAMLGWVGIHGEDHIMQLLDRADKELDSGEFFTARIGLVAQTDPELVMALSVLRMRWVEDFHATTVSERFLIDQVLIAFYHQMRIHELIGNVTARAESMFFGPDPMRVVHGRDDLLPQYEVDEHCKRLGEQLLPLLERCQRMVLRAFRALHTHHRPASCTIQHAAQVNLAHQQLHVHQHQQSD